MISDKFWETKTLALMISDEWMALCDGCGLCCMVKIEDEDSGEVFNTSGSFRLQDVQTCRCRDYEYRLTKSPMCTKLTLDNLEEISWLPQNCAYKRLHTGQPLPSWHYLLSGDRKIIGDRPRF